MFKGYSVFILLFLIVLTIGAPFTIAKSNNEKTLEIINTQSGVIYPPYSSNSEFDATITNKGESFSVSPTLDKVEDIDPEYNPNTSRIKPLAPIIGADDRFPIWVTTQFPYSAVVAVVIRKDNGNIVAATGWLIGPRTVVTAGHVVYDYKTDKWVDIVAIVPGMNGFAPSPNNWPFGSCRANRVFAPEGWTKYHNFDYDYGAIQLNEPIGYQTGWFGYRSQSADMNGLEVSTIGYPSDKSGNIALKSSQWKCFGNILESHPNQLYYNNDFFPGQSGSSLYEEAHPTCGHCGIAIATSYYPEEDFNRATRINQSVFNNLRAWKGWVFP